MPLVKMAEKKTHWYKRETRRKEKAFAVTTSTLMAVHLIGHLGPRTDWHFRSERELRCVRITLRISTNPKSNATAKRLLTKLYPFSKKTQAFPQRKGYFHTKYFEINPKILPDTEAASTNATAAKKEWQHHPSPPREIIPWRLQPAKETLHQT